jgi:hypothetical protein
MQKQRRDFLKITAAGAAGLALTRRAERAFAAWPSTGSLAVNPTIDNMRVVACYDPQMMQKAGATSDYDAEQKLVDSCQVQANMDAMAMQLANQTTADAAWRAIFRTSKPGTGATAWAATKVAIKVNGIAPQNMASAAVLQKFCSIFTGFGVLPTNIFVYDGSSLGSGGVSKLASYFSTTDTTKIPGVVGNNSILGGTINAPIPGGSSAACTANIANGTIDILVNIANNKGHNLAWTGYTTLCMKNHFGTFPPTHDLNFMFNINKSDALLGGTMVRQQLCFVDSLLANSAQKNTGNPNAQPNYLIMGVFAPAVDYLTVKKVREAILGSTHTDATINSYLTTFGYATTDPVWVLVPAASSGTCAGGGTGGTGGGSGAGGAGASGGTSGSGGARSGGASGSGGAASGGASGSGGAASGGSSGSGGAASGGSSGSGGVASGGASGSGGVASGGMSGSGGARSGGATASGGTPGSGGATSGGTGGAVASASGGSAMTGGNSAGAGTGGSGGSQGSTAGGGNSGGGCAVAGIDRRATRWGAMLAFGAVVAERLRRLAGGSDRSS